VSAEYSCANYPWGIPVQEQRAKGNAFILVDVTIESSWGEGRGGKTCLGRGDEKREDLGENQDMGKLHLHQEAPAKNCSFLEKRKF